MDGLTPLSILLPVIFLVVILILIRIVTKSLKQAQPRAYGVTSLTSKGERVKSIGEKTIADFLAKNNIKYVYEQGAIGTWSHGRYNNYKITIPDFYLPDYGVYVEYWGLVNADDERTKTMYVSNMKKKMAMYHRNNIKFVSIYPQNLGNLDWIFRTKFRNATGYELPISQTRS
jgi:hypothetical protein